MTGVKKVLFCIVIFLIGLPFTSTVSAEDGDAERRMEERLTRAEDYVREQLGNNDVVGGVYGIIYKDKLIRSQGFGMMNKQGQTTPSAETLYSIASVTKVFTATAIYQLKDEGLLDLDQPVSTYIPGFRFEKEALSAPVTLRHLLTHSAGGIGSFQTDGLIFSDRNARSSLQDYVQLLKKLEITEPPGQSGIYCNGCYDILGHVIERVSGMSYYDYMKQKIFEPLEMKQTMFGQDLDTVPEPQLAQEYTWFFTRKIHMNRTFEAFGSAQDPDGGIYSTTEDLAKFMAYQLGYGNRTLLKADSIADSRKGYVSTDSSVGEYTASGFEMREIQQTKVYYTTGDGIGSASAVLFIPELQLGIVLLIGEFHPEIQQPIIEGMASIMLGQTPEQVHSTLTLGKLIGGISIVLMVISTVLFALLIRKGLRRSIYSKYLLNTFMSLFGWGVITVPFWYLLLSVRPTAVGFYGYPYDAAIALVMITAVSSLWFLYYLQVVITRKYKSTAQTLR